MKFRNKNVVIREYKKAMYFLVAVLFILYCLGQIQLFKLGSRFYLESITWDCSEEGGITLLITKTGTGCKIAHLRKTQVYLMKSDTNYLH